MIMGEKMNNLPATATHDGQTANIMAIIERIARDPEADIGKLEKMLDMQERILNRNAEQAFSASFARMQAKMPQIDKKGRIEVNGTVRSHYAKFEDINEAVKPILQEHGFGINFRIAQNNGFIVVTAVLRHELGHSETTEISLPADSSGSKNAVQAIGSTVSYGKRYTLCALLNITVAGEDADGLNINQIGTEKAVEIDLLIKEVRAEKASFLKHFNIADVRDLRECDFVRAKAMLNAKKQKQGGAQ